MFKFDCGFSLNQFDLFKKEGGLLPSFLVVQKKPDTELIENLVSERILGDYTFYQSTENTFVFSLHQLFLCFHNCFDKAILYDLDHDKVNREHDLAYLLMQGYMYRLVERGDLMIHSAAIIYNGEGILFCGKSSAGKSTQANLWKE